MRKSDAKKMIQEDPELAVAIILAAAKMTDEQMFARGEVRKKFYDAQEALYNLLHPGWAKQEEERKRNQ